MRQLTSIISLILVLCVSAASSATFDVTATRDSADGSCDSHCSLREAVIAANESSGADVINIPTGVYELSLTGDDEDFCLTGDLDITEAVNIYGMGWSATVIDGLGGDRVFDIRQGANPTQFAGMTIRGGSHLEGGGLRGGLNTYLHLSWMSFVGNDSDVQGGAVHTRGTLILADCLFAANTSGSLAGAIKAEGALEVVRSTFDGNRTVNGGGAISTSMDQTISITDSLFTANIGAYGGALSIDRSEVGLTNVTFVGNAAASGRGGAITTNRGSLSFQNCTLSNNTSVGGGTEIAGSNDPEITIENSILSGPDYFDLCMEEYTSTGHNLSSDESCGLNNGTDIVPADPGLRGLKDNGGPTSTLALLTGSPAIDTGGGQYTATDQRGVARPIGPAPDMGAYEAEGGEPPIGLPLTVPVIAHVDGVGGTPWRSDVAMTNPGAEPSEINVRYTRRAGEVIEQQIQLDAGATILFEDMVSNLFNSGDGQGILEIVPPESGPTPVVASRTFSVSGAERLGQGMPALDPYPEGTYYIPGLLEDTDYRSNIGIAAGDRDLTIQVDLFRGTDGAVGSTFAQMVPAGTQAQWRLPVMFPGLAQSGVPMTAKIRIFGDGIPYGSLVDQLSTDAVTLIASPTSPAVFVPVVAHNPGLQNTFWRSDLYLHNPNPVEAKVYTEYLAEDTDNQDGGPVARPMTVPAFGSVNVSDAAGELFGVTDGKGALVVVAAPEIVVATRTYTTSPSGGTYGLGVPALPQWERTSRPLLLTGIRATDGFRTNIGIIGGERQEGFHLSLIRHDGVVLESVYVDVKPRSMFQESVKKLFSGVAWGSFTVGSVRLSASGQLKTAYSSTVDDSSQDPIFTVATPVH